MPTYQAFEKIKVELKQYVIDNPKVNVFELRLKFGWTQYQTGKMMTELRVCAGINGNEYFLFSTRYFYNKDNPQKYYFICSEAGYAKEHNLQEFERPYKKTDEEAREHRRNLQIAKRLKAKEDGEKAVFDVSKSWPAGKQAKLAAEKLL